MNSQRRKRSNARKWFPSPRDGRRGTATTLEVLEGRTMLAGDTVAAIAPFQNPFNNLDVDFDSRVSARDALQVIHALQMGGPRELSPVASALAAGNPGSTLYLDVTGDNQLNARDVLLVARSLVTTKVLDVNVSVTSLDGNPISSIEVGQDFLIAVDVQDVRDPISATPGVLSAFVDLLYDQTLVSVSQQTPAVGPDFELMVGQQLDLTTPGTIPGFSASSDAVAQPNNNIQRLWTIVAHASAAGLASFSAAFDATAGHDTKLYPDVLVSQDEIEFAGTTLTIEPEPPPALSVAGVALAEGNAGTTSFVFTALLSKPATSEVQVGFATLDAAATAPADYAATSGTLTFAVGESSKVLTVQVAGESLSEADEIFAIQLTRLSGDLENNAAEAQGTILNDDVPPTVSVAAASGVEGSMLAFVVTLSTASGQNVLVPFSTVQGSATSGTDFTPTSGTLTFLPGQVQQTISVAALSDAELDSNETFQMVLSSPTGATLAEGGGSGVGTIGDEPPAVTFSVNDVAQLEGNSGATPLVFTASLSSATTLLVVAAFATADGTAAAPADYAATSGTITFLAGETSKLITVPVVGDLVNEVAETFTLTLAGLSGPFSGGAAMGTATILNDDLPVVSIGNASANEGESLLFTVTLSQAGVDTVTTTFATAPGSAAADTDYTSTSGTLTFTPGQTEQVVTVATLTDAVLDPDETFQVVLGAPTNAALDAVASTGTGTIGDVPPSVSLGLSSLSQIEGSGVNSTFVFTASLAGPTTVPVVAEFSTADITATAPGDYQATSGTITFLAGETAKLITIVVIGDLAFEDDETFAVNLGGVSGPIVGGPASGTGTILNDDLPVLAVAPASGDEGTNLLFTVSLSEASNASVTVPFTTVSGSAGAGTDYTAMSGTLTFAPGQTQQVVTVAALTDAVFDPNETFQLELGVPVNATIAPGGNSATGTIGDVVPNVTLELGNASRPEGNTGTPGLVFTASLSAATTQTVVVTFATSDGAATALDDYAATSGSLTFVPGSTTQFITVALVGDTVSEPNESFTLTLSPASGPVSGGAASATGTIINDDAAPAFAVNDLTINGPRVPPAPPNTKSNAVFTVSLSSSVTAPATIEFATADGSATAGQDYDATSGTLTFQPDGLLFQLVTVQVLGQPNTAPNETFFLNLTNPTTAQLGDGQGQGTILRQESQEIEGTTGNDEFVVFLGGGDSDSIIVRQNGVDLYFFDRITTKSLSIKGLAGDDTLIVDSSNGLVALEDGIFFDGGTGRDELRLEQTGDNFYMHSRYMVGPSLGAGVSETEFQPIEGPLIVQRVTFDHLEPFFDFLPALDLTVTATNEDNAINYSAGTLPLTGLVTIDNQESIEFANKTQLIIDALNGSDTINLNNSIVPLALQSIAIDASDPTGSDTLIVNTINATLLDPTPVPDVLTLTPTDQGAGNVVSSAAVNLVTSFVGIEHLKLVGRMSEGDSFSIRGTRHDDHFFYNVGASPDSGSITGVMNNIPTDLTPNPFPLVPISFSGMGTGAGALRQFNVNDSDGFDTLSYTATGSSSQIAIAQGATTLTVSESLLAVSYGNVVGHFLGQLGVDGAAGNDQIRYVVQAAGNQAVVVLEGGDSDATSDTLTFTALPNDATTVDLREKSVQSTSSAKVFFDGFEKVVLVSSGDDSTLTVNGTPDDDELTYTPTGARAGKFDLAGLGVAFSFTGVAAAFTLGGGDGNAADHVSVRGTAGRDTFRIDATNVVRTATVSQLKTLTLGRTIEILTALGLAGDDTFVVVPGAGIAAGDADDGDLPPFLDNLLINIDGGDPLASDALVIAGDLTGATLAANQFVVLRRSATAVAGTARVYTAAAAWPDITYANVEIVSPKVAGAGFSPNLLLLGPDLDEPNDFLGTATFLGSGANLQIQHAAIFPDSNEHVAVPADQDFYRVVAEQTGTLDFQVYFRPLEAELLPGGGLLGIEVLDVTGTVIARAGAGAVPLFGASNAVPGAVPDTGARVRIPVVAGQSYFLRVFGQLVAGTPNSDVVNGYDATIINTPAPAPFNLELSRRVDPPAAGDPGTGDLPTDAPASDTGRSQFDDVTLDNTPTIYLRLSDAVLLNDLPGNDVSGNAPIGSIAIPFVGAGDPQDPGFRVAIFDGDNTHTPVGFASAVPGFPGLYTFTFSTALAEGLHHINAAVQMVDPRSRTPITGFGPLSVHSLDLVIDTVDPPVFFGAAASAFDGLAAGSDTGVPNTPATFVDRMTSDTTPTFHGVAEANSIIKVYVRLAGPAGPVDILLGQTVAIPTDGTNAYPGGSWSLTSLVDLNALPNPADPGQLWARDGVRQIVVTAEDLAGNVSEPQLLDIFIDTQGPTIAGVGITGDPYDLFGQKTINAPPHGPTPLITSLTILVEDLPVEDVNFLRNAIADGVVSVPGLIVLRGDHNGVIPITSISIVPAAPQVLGEPARDSIVITFGSALPDDRYTLVVSDELVDPVGNALDGENTASEPQPPNFNTGNGINGGDFVARFTVDSRPEIGVYAGKSVLADINGNGYFDPAAADITNRDLPFLFGEVSDQRFAGKFSPTRLPGYDVLAAYGNINGLWRFLIDFNGNGAVDFDENLPAPPGLQINGAAVAGNFDGDATNGDEIALFTGTTFYIFNNARTAASTISTPLRGYPLAGDFDGDGVEDLASYQGDVFSFDFGNDGFGAVQATINFGAPGVLDRAVAADMDGDGIDDIGLWIPRSGTDQHTAEWRFLISADPLGRNRATGQVPTLNHPFSPVPLGTDIGFHFGDPTALPIVGNFDPPVSLGAAQPQTTGSAPPQSTGAAPVAGSSAPTVATPAISSTQARSVVASLYHDILGRSPDAGGWDLFTQQIVSGASREAVARALLTSPEYYGNVVDALYNTYLHRQADVPGRATWVNQLAAGASENSVAAGLMLSVEYAQMHAGNNAFLEALYHDILGRASDASGRSTFLFALGTGGSRTEVVTALLTSTERAAQAVDRAYQDIFGRHAEDAGLQFWSAKLRSGQLTASSLKASLAATDEYFAQAVSDD